jgi:hypothetical protein
MDTPVGGGEVAALGDDDPAAALVVAVGEVDFLRFVPIAPGDEDAAGERGVLGGRAGEDERRGAAGDLGDPPP